MNTPVFLGFTVDDIGLDGYSTEQYLNNILDFYDEYHIKATFFAVPESDGKRMDHRRGYMKIMQDAIKRGHEIAQHGLRHERFEIGIPPEMIMMLPHEGESRKFLAENHGKLVAEHTVDNIRNKLRLGRTIIEDAIGSAVHGFRSAALQSCENMFIALAEEGYRYDSSTYLQKAAWNLINDISYVPEQITRNAFDRKQKDARMKELPLTAEYTWYLEQAKFDRALALAIHDFDGCTATGIPFIPLCHVAPLQEGDKNLGIELYRRLLDHIQTSGMNRQSLTLDEIAKQSTHK